MYLTCQVLTNYLLCCLAAKVEECTRANKIMGDVSDTLDILLAVGGDDYEMLTESEKNSHDITRLSYTAEDKTVLRQYEGVAEHARTLCKFLQDNRNAWPYVTFEIQVAIQNTNAATITIFADVSHMNRTKDLGKREKTVLVKKAGVTVSDSVAQNFTKVERMDPRVEKYCEVYAEDLAHRAGLTSKFLPLALTMPVMLNPLFGLRTKIIGAGLLKESQYDKAESSEY